MNFLATDIPSSDSEDGDYVPPPTPPQPKPGVLTLHKKKPSFVDDAAWDDDDDSGPSDDAADDDDLEFDDDDVAEQARLLKEFEDMKRGAGPSAAAGPAYGAGPPPPAYGAAASSSAARGAGPSSAGAAGASMPPAASSADTLRQDASRAAPRAPASANVATSHPAAPIASAAAPLPSMEPKAVRAASEGMAPPVTQTEPAGSDQPPVAGSKAPASTVQPPAAVSDADEIRPVKKPRVEGEASAEPAAQEPPESKKPSSTIDDIWAEMNASTKKAPPKPQAAATDPGLMGWLSQPAPKPAAKRPFKVKLLGELEDEAKAREAQEVAAASVDKKATPRATGLEAALSIVRGPKRDGVLTKTKEVWNEFKGKDEKVEDELEKYKKDKNRYTDKVAFLERSDVRQWEYEQEGKRRRR